MAQCTSCYCRIIIYYYIIISNTTITIIASFSHILYVLFYINIVCMLLYTINKDVLFLISKFNGGTIPAAYSWMPYCIYVCDIVYMYMILYTCIWYCIHVYDIVYMYMILYICMWYCISVYDIVYMYMILYICIWYCIYNIHCFCSVSYERFIVQLL